MDSPWYKGPSFFHGSEGTNRTTNEELRPAHFQFVHFDPIVDFDQLSSWTKLHRSAAFVLRFVDNIRRKKRGIALQLVILDSGELQQADEMLWKLAQVETCPDADNIGGQSY